MEALSDYLKWEQEVGQQLFPMCNGEETFTSQPVIKLSYGNVFRGDYYFEYGCKQLCLPIKTIVEVKHTLYPDTLIKLENLYRNLDFKANEFTLLIVAKKISARINQSAINWCTIWNEDQLMEKTAIHQNSSANSDIVQGNSELGTEDNKNIQIDDTDNVDRAKEIFSCGNNTLFIGAGLSKSAKLPDWNELLEALLKSSGNNIPFEYINQANSNSISEYLAYSNIVTGRYVVEGFRKSIQKLHIGENIDLNAANEEAKAEIVERMSQVLYKNPDKQSDLVEAVAKLVENKKIKQIITYNYDDLIEEQIKTNDPKCNTFESISNGGSQLNTKIPIYHVHGKITRNKDDYDWPILSEKDYHNLYSNMHNWANVVQLNALYTTTCYFIGFSMTDPNQRRLLDLAWSIENNNMETDNAKVPHFVFLRKEILKGEASEDVNKEHWRQIESMMKQLGLNVIWFNEFNQLPLLIKYISGELGIEKPSV